MLASVIVAVCVKLLEFRIVLLTVGVIPELPVTVQVTVIVFQY